MNIDKIDRKKKYYQKHRNKILQSLRDKRKHQPRREPMAFILGRTLQRISSLLFQIIQKEIEKLLLALLVLSCTSFLVLESARTLAAIEGGGALGKALLCEAVLVGISMLAVATRKMQILRSMVLVGIFALSLLNTIGGPFTSFSEARQRVTSQGEEILILNRVIEQKQTLLARFLALDRVSRARGLESEIASLSDRLTHAKQVMSEQKSESILGLGLAITILFRIIIMAANIIFANRLGQLLREHGVPTRLDKVTKPAKLYLVRT